MNEQKNFFIAIVLSFLILFGFQVWDSGKHHAPSPERPSEISQNSSSSSLSNLNKSVSMVSRSQALKEAPRVNLLSPELKGTVSLRGACLDDLRLVNFKETTQKDSDSVKLLNPEGARDAYTVHWTWKGQNTPNAKTLWSVIQEGPELILTPLKPLHLTWTNAQGVRFNRIFSVDESYMITIQDRIVNQSKAPLTVSAEGEIVRAGKPETSGFYILHEGAIGILGEKLQEPDYKDIEKAKEISVTSTGGWLGFVDKYWLTALIPDSKAVIQGRFSHVNNAYIASLTYTQKTILPGEMYELNHRVFAGAKVLEVLRNYEKDQNIDRFELAVDFGWFYFLTKPLFYILESFHKLFGHFGLAIIFLTVLVKALTFPLGYKSFKSMRKLRILQPKIAQLQTLYGEDKIRLNQELMKLYHKEKANPVSGCLPLLIQGLVFFCLYKVFFVTIEMRHAHFFGWIKDLSEPDPTTLFNLFGLIPWSPPSFLMLGVWPLLMGVTMFMQQKMNPQPLDPAQAKAMMFMPVMFCYFLASFPVGMVIYWTWSNILTIAQQTLMKYLSERT